tara:strand:- start:424 stop:561 length:138 start_codon:yes stop_codon:yes gene_type:complete
MTITTEQWKEYKLWCLDNYKKGYTSVNAPDFEEFIAWIENTYAEV